MEARESNPLPALRDAAFLRVLLVRFTPALIVVAGVAAHGWYERAPLVLIPLSIMVWGMAWAFYTTLKLHRAGQPMVLIAADRTPWLTLAIAIVFVGCVMLGGRNLGLSMGTAILRIREWLSGL